MNHSTEEFESAILMQGALITAIEKHNDFIYEVRGFVNGIRHEWSSAGHCFRGNVRVPEYDLVFDGVRKFYVPSTKMYNLTAGKEYPIILTLRGFQIVDDLGKPRCMFPGIKSEFKRESQKSLIVNP